MELKDFVKVYKNKSNNQVKFDIKKRKLREFDMDFKDLLKIKISPSKRII